MHTPDWERKDWLTFAVLFAICGGPLLLIFAPAAWPMVLIMLAWVAFLVLV